MLLRRREREREGEGESASEGEAGEEGKQKNISERSEARSQIDAQSSR